jgi:transposase-like protein
MRKINLGERPGRGGELGGWYAAALEDQASSGLSVAEYAAQLGVTAATLYQWRRRLAGGGGGPVERGRSGRPGPRGLVEVTVGSGAEAAREAEGFVVRLARHRKVEVPGGFDAAELRRLVVALESC